MAFHGILSRMGMLGGLMGSARNEGKSEGGDEDNGGGGRRLGHGSSATAAAYATAATARSLPPQRPQEDERRVGTGGGATPTLWRKEHDSRQPRDMNVAYETNVGGPPGSRIRLPQGVGAGGVAGQVLRLVQPGGGGGRISPSGNGERGGPIDLAIERRRRQAFPPGLMFADGSLGVGMSIPARSLSSVPPPRSHNVSIATPGHEEPPCLPVITGSAAVSTKAPATSAAPARGTEAALEIVEILDDDDEEEEATAAKTGGRGGGGGKRHSKPSGRLPPAQPPQEQRASPSRRSPDKRPRSDAVNGSSSNSPFAIGPAVPANTGGRYGAGDLSEDDEDDVSHLSGAKLYSEKSLREMQMRKKPMNPIGKGEETSSESSRKRGRSTSPSVGGRAISSLARDKYVLPQGPHLASIFLQRRQQQQQAHPPPPLPQQSPPQRASELEQSRGPLKKDWLNGSGGIWGQMGLVGNKEAREEQRKSVAEEVIVVGSDDEDAASDAMGGGAAAATSTRRRRSRRGIGIYSDDGGGKGEPASMEIDNLDDLFGSGGGGGGGGSLAVDGGLLDEDDFGNVPMIDSCLVFLLESAEQEALALSQQAASSSSAGGGGGAAAAASSSSSSSSAPARAAAAGGGGPKHFQFSQEQLKDIVMRLLTEEVLSDEILNRAVDMLRKITQAEDILLFNTFWYEKIKNGYLNDVTQWVAKALKKRTSTKALRMACVPVNISNVHWILVVVDLIRDAVQVWDPAGTDYATSSIPHNIKDAISKAIPSANNLHVYNPPPGLPQQSDTINCGLFVILYIIHHCFLEPYDKGTAQYACKFTIKAEDLFRYRLFLLAWILHSQTSLLKWTTPVLSSFLGANEPRLAHDEEREKKELRRRVAARRKVYLSLVQDDEKKREQLINLSMELLNRLSDGKIVFLKTAWFNDVKAGRCDGALVHLNETETGHPLTDKVKGIVAPIMLNGFWVVAMIDIDGRGGCIHLYGAQGTIDSNAGTRPIERFLRTRLGGYWLTKVWPMCGLSEAAVSIKVILLAMKVCRGRSIPKGPMEYVEHGGGEGSAVKEGQVERHWADKMGIMRWLLRHTARVV